ncbi:MAG: hypothetical protein HN417_05655 [Desulfobacula sp.]|nr:hypothetical protein [Desulfobacula sp.]
MDFPANTIQQRSWFKECTLFCKGRDRTGCWIMLAKEMGFVGGQQFPVIIHYHVFLF